MRHDDAFRMLNYPRPAVVTVALLALLLAAACAVAVAQAPTPGPPAAPAPPPPAPQIAPSGTPAWTVDLMTTDGVALFGGVAVEGIGP